jgi:hypothetical protein
MRRTPIIVLALAVLGVAAALWVKHYSRTPRIPESSATVIPQTNPAAPLPVPTQTSNAPLAIALGRTGQPFAARRQALQALARPLGREDVQAIYESLRDGGQHPGTLPSGEHVLQNELMTLLARQEPPPADLVQELCALSRNPAQDAVTRDYALQQLVGCSLQPTNRFGGDRARAHEALWDALAERGGTLAGTALLGLHRIAPRDQSFDTNRLNTAALALAVDSTASPLARTAALQVCAQRRLQAALPMATDLARGTAGLTLRAAAIAAVGELGGPTEVRVLENLQTVPDPVVQNAAAAALKKLQARLRLATSKLPNAG